MLKFIKMNIIKTETTIEQQQNVQQPVVGSPNCYCGGTRQLGSIELLCAGCRKWFHKGCLKDIEEYDDLLPFMVAYKFICQHCSEHGCEKWTFPRKIDFASITVMAIANMTFHQPGTFFHVSDIADYMKKNWKSLSTGKKPKAKGRKWSQKMLSILQMKTGHFEMHPNDDNAFALKEKDLLQIGPNYENAATAVKGRHQQQMEAKKQCGRPQKRANDAEQQQEKQRPTTRAQMKRQKLEGVQQKQNGTMAPPLFDDPPQLQIRQKNFNNNSRSQSRSTTGASFTSQVPSQFSFTMARQRQYPVIDLENEDGHFFYLLDHQAELAEFARKHSFDITIRQSDTSITFAVVYTNPIKQEPSTSASVPPLRQAQRAITFADNGTSMEVRKWDNSVHIGDDNVPKYRWESFVCAIKGMCLQFLLGQ